MRFLIDNALSPLVLLEFLLNSLEALREDLEKGAVAVLEDSRIRLRKLPIVDK